VKALLRPVYVSCFVTDYTSVLADGQHLSWMPFLPCFIPKQDFIKYQKRVVLTVDDANAAKNPVLSEISAKVQSSDGS